MTAKRRRRRSNARGRVKRTLGSFLPPLSDQTVQQDSKRPVLLKKPPKEDWEEALEAERRDWAKFLIQCRKEEERRLQTYCRWRWINLTDLVRQGYPIKPLTLHTYLHRRTIVQYCQSLSLVIQILSFPGCHQVYFDNLYLAPLLAEQRFLMIKGVTVRVS